MHHKTHTAAAQNPTSPFSRIHPMNPEAAPPRATTKSTFPRNNPLHHKTHIAAAKNPISAFSRIHPMNPEPGGCPIHDIASTQPLTPADPCDTPDTHKQRRRQE